MQIKRDIFIDHLIAQIQGPLDSNQMSEETLDFNPRYFFSSGLLFPQGYFKGPSVNAIDNILVEDDGENLEEVTLDEESLLSSNGSCKSSDTSAGDEADSSLEEILENEDLFEQRMNSSISLTLILSKDGKFNIVIKAAKYIQEKEGRISKFKRKPYIYDVDFICSQFEGSNNKSFHIDKDLELILNNRGNKFLNDKGLYLVSISLINKNKAINNLIDGNDIFYQPSMSIKLKEGHIVDISSLNKKRKSEIDSLYSFNKKYAIGHSCSADWRKNGELIEVFSSNIPVYEIKNSKPASYSGLDMLDLSQQSKAKEILEDINKNLIRDYDQWIKNQENELNTLNISSNDKINLLKNLKECLEAKERISEGIEVLSKDPNALKAFMYMNEAVLDQQLRYGKSIRDLDEPLSNIPEINDKDNWGYKGKWRTFQLAFILSSIPDTIKINSSDKSAYLLWFPTGGGKTEAYLGLTAFTIFYFRLVSEISEGKFETGVLVLMRYTLRLLTLQQFQRASTLICSMERIRFKNKDTLGNKKISIGLWVGNSLTSKSSKDDFKRANDAKHTNINPFIVKYCPYCSTSIDIKNGRWQGLETVKKKGINIKCPDSSCHFNISLPIYFTDETVYKEQPDLVLGTVDKFALLPFYDDARKIFNKNDDLLIPPRLIIQDELHLINHALGTTVALFESIILELSKNKSFGSPKIIASTATIKGADEQCKNLYLAEKGSIVFPPFGINLDDNYFSKIDKNSTGRKYLGIFNQGESQRSTTFINTVKSLLEKSGEIKDDNYWTILAYFNSLREKASAYHYVVSDVKDKINVKLRDFDIQNIAELDSRAESKDIEDILQRMEKSKIGEDECIDVCLSSNMISVGIDIERLNIMTVFGQCRSTSEYIQATSRIGRNKDNPGLAIIIYHPFRQRDKSFFEQFRSFHESFYEHVEPSSITPFSKPSRSRTLPSIIVTYHRHIDMLNSPKDIKDEHIKNCKNFIIKRVESIDVSELNGTLEDVDEFYNKIMNGNFEYWTNLDPLKGEKKKNRHLCLLISYTEINKEGIREDINKFSFANMNMRDVDGGCQGESVNVAD